MKLERLWATAACQHGLFSRAQVLDAGGSDRGIHRRLASGSWLLVAPGVYSLPGFADCWERDLRAGLLAVGPAAVVSHEAAGQLHGFSGIPRDRCTLSAPRYSHPRVVGAFVHQLSDILPGHVLVLRGFPATTPARTIVDLAAVQTRGRLGHVLDDALAARKLTVLDVGTCLGEVTRRGKPGVQKLARLLDERGPGHQPPASELERLMLHAATLHGEAPPVGQYRFPGRQVICGCVDYAYPDELVILEADGRRWHSRMKDMARDRERDNEAARAGWVTLRFLHEVLKNDPEDVNATIRETRDRRRAFLHPNWRQ